ncbi:MAG TPA: transcription-repair coupling factor [Nitrospirae bacterium]|nr:transcription-repair coupling factor [Nitrospirota bacterium]
MSKVFSELITSEARRLHSEIEKNVTSKKINNISIPHSSIFLNLMPNSFLLIEEDYESSRQLFQDFIFFKNLLNTNKEVVFFPISSNIEMVGKRIEALRQYLHNSSCSLITSLEAINQSIDIFSLDEGFKTLALNGEIERDVLRQWLLKNGYREVSMVIDKGEFTQRTFIFDIFPCTSNEPVRIEFFGDTIESIRIIDIETQLSVRNCDKVIIFSALERISSEDLLNQLSILKKSSLIVASKIREIEISSIEEPIRLYHRQISTDFINANEKGFSGLGIFSNERKSFSEIASFVLSAPTPILFVMQSRAQGERLNDLLQGKDNLLPYVQLDEAGCYNGLRCITNGDLSSGLNLDSIIILSDKEIFGDRLPIKASKRQKLSRILLNLEELKIGDYLVHKDYGIGRFKGLSRQSVGNYECDVIIIEYNNGTLYIPAENIHLIQKHSSSDSQFPVVDTIGSKNWLKRKLKARLGAEEIAQKLTKLYAERSVVKGFQFSEDTVLHREFDDFFNYQITPDQLKATEDILKIMTSPKPMDMLLCGDVGYGKTEVVMRAIFRAVYDKKQVAFLVPTTILAEQHYRTLKARFSGFDVKIDLLSRFRSPSEKAKTLKALSKHEIDIIIGTHSLLRKDISFADLGLLVIDEEQKFGVQQKERLKELRKGVDVITLTATPIPRTLQMSLSGIRDMTIIETPPEDRVAVKTFTSVYNEEIIREAIDRELRRQGQVFYVYNRINQLDEKIEKIKMMIKEIRVAVAHGGMPERDLEKVMLSFMNRQVDVLVCTAIIGAGLDIPSANTIIVDRADLFGLSDLYQLRGRVGRSNVQAYAYLLIPERESISEDAMKRLQAVQDLAYLGAGFRLALKDLEIRGAGNILGAEQSGHIAKVGFDMYMEMIEEAVATIKGEIRYATLNPEIRLLISSYIPEDFIEDVTIRISIYRRLSDCKSLEELRDLKIELIDRFGKLPAVIENLFTLLNIKILARILFIVKVYEDNECFRFYFLNHDLEQYGISEEYFVKVFNVLNGLSKKIKDLRFMKDGFYFKKIKNEKINAIDYCENTLKLIRDSMGL